MNLNTFDLSVFVEVPAAKVTKAWKTAAGMQSWFLATANFVTDEGDARSANNPCRAEDMYWWEWLDQSVETGTIIESSSSHLKFTYGQSVEVCVRWNSIADGTLIILSQTQVNDDLDELIRTYTSTLQSWTFYLTNLKAHLEHGIDLRDKIPTRADHANV